jgi:hypothetical protein
MKKSARVIVLFSMCTFFILAACQLTATATPQPTYTLYPTYTPFPTATDLPTATVTPTEISPTATLVATVTPTKKPYIPPTATKVPASDPGNNQSGGGLTPVDWKNETSHSIRIVAVGPTTYTLELTAQQQIEVQWMAGHYSVKYYLDGSSSVSGTDTVDVLSEQHNLYVLNFR